MSEFPIAERLHKNAGIHCATLAVTQNVVIGPGWLQLAQPDAALRNGTLTFVKSGSRTFCITCAHVVQHYRDVLAASGDPHSHTMRTMLNGFHVIFDCFIQPSTHQGESLPDVAIREINPDHIAHIGKEAIDLDVMKEPPDDIRHAYAVGFPEKLKYHKHEDASGYRVSLPQIEILAELPRRPERRFSMFSNLEEKPALDIDYSGMSGGPIFWSTEHEYGILGIIYEGGPGEGNQTIFVYGEIATPAVIRNWISQCPARPVLHSA
ncbi:hypothetical protein [Bradyrhizobium sp. AUGA SZCCT0431]|uniref:hypothetical protein n=1 Tax=Bradyrhizobium sp. AUGA SZCCT0431 TaxID=2807674 RepID=UPI001BA4D5AB|nr:hypothetical protein [Bradyrhizobium sp. AUGA SZCCT0431]MBR1142673.1 hypothetical protein [Bradyrhizobium sp. AUGA SZCCT0431]